MLATFLLFGATTAYDSDGDGVDDMCEAAFGMDPLVADSDGDTVPDGQEFYNWLYLDLVLVQGLPLTLSEYSDANGGLTGLACLDAWDRDSDGIINALDPDDDGDGLITGLEETGADTDCLPGTGSPAGDGIPDYLDRDSDADGLPDDRYGDGLGDSDGDGQADFLDCAESGCAGDSDIDGILNCDETALCPKKPSNPGWCALDPDMDDDGVIDGLEQVDTDQDGQPDYYDTDDDGDGLTSAEENGITCPKGEPLDHDYELVSGYWTFRCAGTVYDFGGDDVSLRPDTDGDGIPDFRDTDDDNDGIPTADELAAGTDPYDASSPGTDSGTDTGTPTTVPSGTTTPSPTGDTGALEEEEAETGCGCATPGAPNPTWLLLLATLRRRRP